MSQENVGIVPYTSAFLHGPSRSVTNLLIQRQCAADRVDHVGMLFDPVVLQWVENALSRHGPANPHYMPHC